MCSLPSTFILLSDSKQTLVILEIKTRSARNKGNGCILRTSVTFFSKTMSLNLNHSILKRPVYLRRMFMQRARHMYS